MNVSSECVYIKVRQDTKAFESLDAFATVVAYCVNSVDQTPHTVLFSL